MPSPEPIELYVSETTGLTAIGRPAGGTYTWTSSDPAKVEIVGHGSHVTVKGLDEGDFTVSVNHSPPGCTCSDQVNIKVRYEIRHILVAQGIEFNNTDLRSQPGIYKKGDEQIPNGYLTEKLQKVSPAALELKGDSLTFKSVEQGVKYTLDVTTSRTEFRKMLETPGKSGTKDLEHWIVIYDGHSRYGRGACFATSPPRGENWENSVNPSTGPNGLYRMGYPFVGVPVSDILHHGYITDAISVKVKSVPVADREFKGALTPTPFKQLKANAKSYLERRIKVLEKRLHGGSQSELKECADNLRNLDELDKLLRVVGDTIPLGKIGAPIGPDDEIWAYQSGEGPAAMLQAGWKDTVSKPMDLEATALKCRAFCHFGCESYMHYHGVLRNRKKWEKSGQVDNFAYFTSDLSLSITGPFWLYHLFTYDQFNAGKPWQGSLEHARVNTNTAIRNWCKTWNLANPDDQQRPYEIL